MIAKISPPLTFLFTDIEGSTRLWEKQPQAMQVALKRHDDILNQIIADNQGQVFKTVGDAFCAVFASAADALRAAVGIQHALSGEPWPEDIATLRVRIALHTGQAEPRGSDYFGPPLNRVARLMAVGHGCQILLSLACQELIRDALPVGVSLRNLGSYHLKDLELPEQIFQVAGPDLQAEFPPLRTFEAALTNLPAQLTTFVGRAHELSALAALIRQADVRLITLTGPGGIGKTRLSLELGASLLDEFPQGVWFVDLSATYEAAMVVPRIARVLGMKESPAGSILEDLQQHLRGRHLLLILDNFEQVVSAASQIGELLAVATEVKMVISSRERLQLAAEHDFPVPPLGLPALHRKQTPEAYAESEAVRLFLQRARAARADFEITDKNAAAIVDICIQLDGLPLAIELAAARTRMLTPQLIAQRLTNRLATLTGGGRDLPARQRTLRGAIDWSHDLLDDEEQRLFRRLSVCSGGWTLPTAEALAPEDPDVLDRLESLLDKSLVHQSSELGDEPRFALYETIREYAIEKLESADELAETGRRHAIYYTEFSEAHGFSLDEERDLVQRSPLLLAELDNFRTALHFLCDTQDRESALRLVSPLWQLWDFAGINLEGANWARRALALPGEAQPLVEGNALRTTANVLLVEVASGTYEELTEVEILYQRALDHYRSIEYQPGMVASLHNLANIYRERDHDHEKAIRIYEEALEWARALNRPAQISSELTGMGIAYASLERFDESLVCLNESLGVARTAGNRTIEILALFYRGTVVWRAGHLDASESDARAHLALLENTQLAGQTAFGVFMFARLAFSRHQYERVARLLGAQEAIVPVARMGLNEADSADYRKISEAALHHLGQETYDQCWTEGLSMERQRLLDYLKG